MSIKKMVSIALAVQSAKEDMGMFSEVRYDPIFTRWAEDAEREIGSFYAYEREYVTVEMCDDKHRAPLPCEVAIILGIACGTYNGEASTAYFRNMYNYYGNNYYADRYVGFLGSNVDVQRSPVNCQWEIRNNHIVFLSPMTYTEITLDAMVEQRDSQGLLMIGENHLDAVSKYIQYMRAGQTRWLPSEYRISPRERDIMGREWERACAHARAQDAAVNAPDQEFLTDIYNDPMSGSSRCVRRYADEFQRG